MTTSHARGGSELAKLALGLPVRERVGLALVPAALAADRLKGSSEFSTAKRGLDLGRRWFDGEHFDLAQIPDVLFDEEDKGIDRNALDALSESERAAWTVMSASLAYVSYYSYTAVGKLPHPLLGDHIEDENWDALDKFTRNLWGGLPDRVLKAAKYLRRQGAPASFAQLMEAAAAT